METIIQVIAIIIAAYWTLQFLAFAGHSSGHNSMIIDVILMWFVNIWFFAHPGLSKYHLLWAIPACWFAGFLVTGIIGIIRRM